MELPQPAAIASASVKLALALILAAQISSPLSVVLTEQGGAPDDQPLSLIDWASYTRAFNKNYTSLTQQIIRHKSFMVKTILVFLSVTRYKFNKLNYYLSINRYSDLTPDEELRKLSGDLDDEPSDRETHDGLMDDEQVERLLQAELTHQGRGGEIAAAGRRLDPAAQVKRRRRRWTERDDVQLQIEAKHLGALAGSSGCKLTFSDLVRIPGADSCRADEESAKLSIKWTVPSNNPDYKPIEKLQKAASIARGQPSATGARLCPPTAELSRQQPAASGPHVVELNDPSGKLSLQMQQPSGGGETKQADDLVIKDWRTSGCVAPPYDQGECQSCYAISSMAFLEFAFCMSQGGVLTPLSAQYLVSCGPQFKRESDPKMKIEFHGCNMGRSRQAMFFVKDYGAELEANMPYLAQDTPCPIGPGAPLKSKGYLRPNVRQHVRMAANTKQLELALKVGPVIVNFREPMDFMAYGGGMVGSCYQRGGHAMLIVGHGVESGRPYLIIKNSFGADWGMKGYFKFDRKATIECVRDFILPRVYFPSKGAQARRAKAYLASRQSRTDEPEADRLLDFGPGGLFGE